MTSLHLSKTWCLLNNQVPRTCTSSPSKASRVAWTGCPLQVWVTWWWPQWRKASQNSGRRVSLLFQLARLCQRWGCTVYIFFPIVSLHWNCGLILVSLLSSQPSCHDRLIHALKDLTSLNLSWSVDSCHVLVDWGGEHWSSANALESSQDVSHNHRRVLDLNVTPLFVVPNNSPWLW